MSKECCNEKAVMRYTWPGKDESYCCVWHAISTSNIALAMGLHLQIILMQFEESVLNPKCCNPKSA